MSLQSYPKFFNSIDDCFVDNIHFLSFGKAEFIDKGDKYVCELAIPEHMVKYVKLYELNNQICITIEQINKPCNFNIDYLNNDNKIIKQYTIEKIERTINLPEHIIKNSLNAKYVSGKMDIHILKSAF